MKSFNNTHTTCALIITSVLVAGCSSSSSSPEAVYPYGTLAEAPAAAALNIKASGTAAGNPPKLGTRSGTFTEPGAFETAGGTNAKLEEGYRLVVEGEQEYDSSYDYVKSFDDGNLSGIAGVATDVATMPSAGTATYNGRSKAILFAGGGQQIFALNSGNAVVNVDFASAKVDATLDGFTAIDLTEQSAQAPIDAITITGMDISGTSFSGGEITTSLSGTDILSSVGLDTVSNTAGDFYGPIDSAIDAPDEVGGTFVLTGTNGFVAGDFVAD